ncbi:MAG: 3-(cis-5,6-dihydroxycyclohexa-1,3-dien-1-yl)propanoate dehydrogenase [Nitrososphaerales archaeon]
MGWLDGNVVLVIGAGSGIGRSVVETFLKEGAKIGVLELNPLKVEELKKIGSDVLAIQGDATLLKDNERAVADTVRSFGKLNVLVCCPGVFDNFATLIDMPAEKLGEAFDEIFSVNVMSYLFSTKAALSELLKTEGSIIYTASQASFIPGAGGALYTATKFAVRGLVLEMAHELAPKIRVNGVAPGATLTDMRGLKSFGKHEQKVSAQENFEERLRRSNPLQMVPTPEDHSYAYLYLASKKLSRVVTGTIMHTDAGTFARGYARLAGLIGRDPPNQ